VLGWRQVSVKVSSSSFLVFICEKKQGRRVSWVSINGDYSFSFAKFNLE
jgi:hypothetical protein